MEPEAMKFVKTFEEVNKHLRNHENSTSTKYVLTKIPKDFRADNVKPSPTSQVNWIKGVPYFKFGTVTFACHQGKDRGIADKKRYAKMRDEKACSDLAVMKRKNWAQSTKKVGCPASFNVSRVIRMSHHKVPESESRYGKTKMANVIKRQVGNDTLVGEEGYIFTLPSSEDHKYHLMEANTLNPPLKILLRMNNP